MSCEHCINEKSFYRAEDHGMTADISVCGNMLIADLYSDYAQFPIKFCPNCGEPLTPIKPLSVGRLKSMSAEPLKYWVWIEIFDPTQWHFDAFSGYYRTISDYTDGEAFCCGWPGTCYSWDYCDYGKTWLAYARPPKEQTHDN